MTAGEMLSLAAASARQQPDTIGTGRYQYVETDSRYLRTTVSASGSRSVLVPVHRQQWIAADGSGRLRTRRGVPRPPSTGGDQAGREADEECRSVTEDETFAPGGLHLMWQPDSLSDDPATLRGQLALGRTDLRPAVVLDAVRSLYNEQPIAPAVRAAALCVVADLPELWHDTDEADDSKGISVGIESDHAGLPTRYVMIFDRVDGQLLSSQQVLTTSAGKLAVPIPSVISHTDYLRSARSDTTEAAGSV
jgi:hypothetical protein